MYAQAAQLDHHTAGLCLSFGRKLCLVLCWVVFATSQTSEQAPRLSA